MPWKEVTTVSQRYELVRLYLAGQVPMTTLCARFGVSRKTAYKWVARYRDGGRAALTDQSRRPHASPTQLPDEQATAILALADDHPTWGGKKLHYALAAAGMEPTPAPSTITKLLRRMGRLREQPITPRALIRFEHPAANDLWQMDFKGWHTLRSGRVHPLSVVDDHSRFLLLLHAAANQERATVQPLLTACFRQYGLPWAILTDNGAPWGSADPHARTGLEIWLMQLGITPLHGRPYHPQTQGKVERFHRTLQADVFAGPPFRNLADAQTACDRFRQIYNHRRPHEALNHRPPDTAYTMSARPFPETIPEPVYADDAAVRIVSGKGVLHYGGRRLAVGQGYAGQRIGIYPTDVDGVVRVQFYATTLTEVDLRTLPLP